MLVVYNTLRRKKVRFKTIEEGRVRMYVCGPTVYDSSHLGHARSIVAFDLIRRYLEFKGYNVRYIQNFTDIDDKMIKRAQEQGVTTAELASKYIQEYFEDFDPLSVKRATIYPIATEHIPEMIETIQQLIEKDFAYEVNGSVYFRVRKFKGYGKLSGRSQSEPPEEADQAENKEKEHPEDFALWKAMKPDEPFWKSPWGKGRPGWHIECSVMSMKYLVDVIDIHGGGLDLVFPHHTNEIAQAEALTGKRFVRYWIHNGFLTVNKEKMSKSLGNFFTIKEITSKYDPEVVRLFLVSSHYRSPVDFSDSLLEEAKARLDRIHNAIDLLQHRLREAREAESLTPAKPSATDEEIWLALKKLQEEFEGAMDDDFNSPIALASLSQFLSRLNSALSESGSMTAGTLKEVSVTLDAYGEVLGIYRQRMATEKVAGVDSSVVEGLIDLLIKTREEMRARKEWAASDRIRSRLQELGIIIEDSPTGPIWKWK
jgi:cysteinyl-tRNA synthetase